MFEAGQQRSEKNVYTEYADPKRDEWATKIQPALKKAKLKTLVKACWNKLSRRELIELRAGRSKPHRKNQELLLAILRKLQLIWANPSQNQLLSDSQPNNVWR
jgi:hypothetical protein